MNPDKRKDTEKKRHKAYKRLMQDITNYPDDGYYNYALALKRDGVSWNKIIEYTGYYVE